MRSLSRSVLLFLLVLAAGCQSGEDYITKSNAVMAQRERGLNQKDMTLYLASISKRYGGDVTGYTAIEKRAKHLFSSIDTIKYTSSERSIYAEDDGRVRVVQRFAMELTKDGQTKSLSGQEQLYLVKDGDLYQIVEGL